MNLRQAVGSLLIVGVEGTQLSSLERAWLRLIQPSGVILFRRNIEAAQQTLELLEAAATLGTASFFRCVDLEGGLVDRLRDLVGPAPSVAAVAATGKTKLFRRHGQLIGTETAMLGFNTTFAPVLDLGLPASARVMRTRVASPSPKIVLAYASAFLSGLKKAGVLGCGKHFPGLGAGTLDSHADTPEIDRAWPQLWQEDLLPYRKLRRELGMVMVAHALYPRVKEAAEPASVSPFWINHVLQRRIGFRGLIITDDMEMGGILSQMSVEEGAVRAVEAGAHLVEVCREPVLVLKTYEALLSEAERSPAFRKRLERAAQKVEREKRRLLARSSQHRFPEAADIESMREQMKRFTDLVEETGARLKAAP